MGDGVAEGGLPVADPREAECRLWAAFGRGLLVDLRVGDPEADDPAHADRWDESRRVRAEVVVALLLGAVDPVAGYVPKIRLAGALVEGSLDVRQGIVDCAAELTGCRFADGLLLGEARTHTLDFSGSVLEIVDATAAEIGGHLILDRCQARAISVELAHITGRVSLNGAHLVNPGANALNADGMTVDGGMFCQEGFQAEGEIRLFGAHIGGRLRLNGAHLINPGANALNADGMTVDGGMSCQEGFQAEGEIRLIGAHISGALMLDGAHLINPGANALNAGRMTVDGSMSCQEGFQAEGEIRLIVVHISGRLRLNGAHLINPGANALNAEGMTVDGGMSCQAGFHAEGEIRLIGAHITGALMLDGAHLINPGANALNAGRMTVDGSMSCQEGFHAEGEIRLIVVHISGRLRLDGAHLINPGANALNADGMTVDGSMSCQAGFQAEGEIRLIGAHISGQLSFRGATLSSPGRTAMECETLEADSLWLDGVTVTGTVSLMSARVRVLHDDPSSWPGQMLLDGFAYDDLRPYTAAGRHGQSGRLSWLANAEADYRAQPYEQLAAYYRRLGHDEEARRVLVAKQRRHREGLGIGGKIVGYALDWIVGYGYRPVRAFAWLVVLLAAGSVYFTVNRPAPLDPAHHPHYQPVLYAADLLIPIVNLGQSNTWAPAGPAQWVAGALIAMGWILATAVVAGITRILTRA